MNYTVIAQPFDMGTIKDKALKPLEEASEAREAVQRYAQSGYLGVDASVPGNMGVFVGTMRNKAIYECCDTLQATFNLLSALGVTQRELTDAMGQVHAHNEARGRYAEAGDDA